MIMVGTLGWVVATIVVILLGEGYADYLWVCVAGLGVAAFGGLVFLVQRHAVRRGDRSAQSGL